MAKLAGEASSFVNAIKQIKQDDALRLAARITAQLSETPGETGRIILFTGLAADASVSLMAAQYARALLELQPGRAALLDAKFNAPDLHARFGLPVSPGLMEALHGHAALRAAVYTTLHPRLAVLPAGDVTTGALCSDTPLGELFAELRRRFRFIVIDAAPLMQSISTALIAAHADGVVLAIAAGRHTRSQLSEARREVQMTRATLLGVALYE